MPNKNLIKQNLVEQSLIEVENLSKEFVTKRSFRPALRVRAVDGVSFNIFKGETFGLVGESGCGKSTLGRTIMGLYVPTSGSVRFEGGAVSTQMIFQDPFSSLNPFMKVKEIVAEPLELHAKLQYQKISKAEKDAQIAEMLQKVGLSAEDMHRYPQQFSGGQRQRISIARSLIVKPQFVFCDEPISALDVSIQAQVVNLLEDLQKEFSLTYLFVAHDLSMVRHISHRIAVMYQGKIVEIAQSGEIYENPLHPYTQTLLASVPIPDPKLAQKTVITPDTLLRTASDFDATAEKSPCAFYPRCLKKTAKCAEANILLHNTSTAQSEHLVACCMS